MPVARRAATLQYFISEVSQGEVTHIQEHVRPGEVADSESHLLRANSRSKQLLVGAMCFWLA
jgi:hypothetical protein